MIRQLHGKFYRLLLVSLGTFFVALGVIGAVLPIMPTTPFLLLAAACYARSSDQLYRRLLDSQPFGPIIREYRDLGSIPVTAKGIAMLMILVSFSISIGVFIDNHYLRLLMASIALGVSAYMYYLPSRH